MKRKVTISLYEEDYFAFLKLVEAKFIFARDSGRWAGSFAEFKKARLSTIASHCLRAAVEKEMDTYSEELQMMQVGPPPPPPICEVAENNLQLCNLPEAAYAN